MLRSRSRKDTEEGKVQWRNVGGYGLETLWSADDSQLYQLICHQPISMQDPTQWPRSDINAKAQRSTVIAPPFAQLNCMENVIMAR